MLRLGQPPDEIGAHRVRSNLPSLARIEAFQTEIESVEATEKLPKFLPGVFPAIDDDQRRAVAFIDPAVNRGALRIEAILTGLRAWEIGRAQIPHRQPCFNSLDQLGVGLSNARLRWLHARKLIATLTAVHPFKSPDSQ